MNNFLNIIPTPKYCSYEQDGFINVKLVHVVGNPEIILQNALDVLAKESGFVYADMEMADLIIYADYKMVPSGCLDSKERKFFEEKYAKEQGYILKHISEKKLIAVAPCQVGCAYSIMTLVQILDKKVKNLVIRDAPDFRYRGIKWLIWAETGIWSYDFGDGMEAIKKEWSEN